MEQSLIEQYARLAIEKGVNIQRGQKLLINCPVNCSAFAALLMEAAYKAGSGEVFMRWADEGTDRARYLYGPEDIFDSYPKWKKMMMNTLVDEGAAVISISAADPDALRGVPGERVSRSYVTLRKALNHYQEMLMGNSSQWCVLAVPSDAWAKKVFPGERSAKRAVEKLWEAILSASRVDGNDPAENWNNHLAAIKSNAEKLNGYNFKSLTYRNGLGTDLELSLPEGHIWLGGSEYSQRGLEFLANIPTEEIFTTPDRASANGIVYASKPLVYMGEVIEDFSIEFKNGRAVNAKARKNQAVLERLLTVVPGSNYLGEVALVPYNSPISRSGVLFYNTLYDENASCHLALGKAYPSCVRGVEGKTDAELKRMGINCSMEHVDFMIGTADMSITGVTQSGDSVPVFIDGNFAI